jgi:hypothetical protein
MISLRRFSAFLAFTLIGSFVTSCGDAITNPTAARPAPGAANRKVSLPTFPTAVGTVSSTTNSDATVNARILIFKSGAATIQFSTGAFSDATNSGTPNGYFQSLVYSIYSSDGKLVATRTITTKKLTLSSYAEQINLCAPTSAKDDGDDNDDNDGGHAACTAQYDLSYSTVVTATITGIGSSKHDLKETYALSLMAAEEYAPDIDLANAPVSVAGGNRSSTQVNAITNVATTYSIDFSNTKSIIVGTDTPAPPTVGIATACLVTLNGTPQVALLGQNGFSFVGSPAQFLAPGATVPCTFKLTLPAGTYTLGITALPGAPGDYDPSNNTTSVKLVVGAASTPGAPTVTFDVPSLAIVGSPDLTFKAGTTPQFNANVAVTSEPAVALGAACSARLLQNGSPVAGQTATGTISAVFALGSTSATAVCSFSFPHPIGSVASTVSAGYNVEVTVNPVGTAYNAASVTKSFTVTSLFEADLQALNIASLPSAGSATQTNTNGQATLAVGATGNFRLIVSNNELTGAAAAGGTCSIISVKDGNNNVLTPGANTFTDQLLTTSFTLAGAQTSTSSTTGCDFSFTPNAGGAFFVTVGYTPSQPDPLVNNDQSYTLTITSAAQFSLTSVTPTGSELYTIDASGNLVQVLQQMASVTRLAMLLIPGDPNAAIGAFTLTSRVRTGGTSGNVTLLQGSTPVNLPLSYNPDDTPPTVDIANSPYCTGATLTPSFASGGLIFTTGGTGFVCSEHTLVGTQNFQKIIVSVASALDNQACVGTTAACGSTAVAPALFQPQFGSSITKPWICFEFSLTYTLQGGTQQSAQASESFYLDNSSGSSTTRVGHGFSGTLPSTAVNGPCA